MEEELGNTQPPTFNQFCKIHMGQGKEKNATIFRLRIPLPGKGSILCLIF